MDMSTTSGWHGGGLGRRRGVNADSEGAEQDSTPTSSLDFEFMEFLAKALLQGQDDEVTVEDLVEAFRTGLPVGLDEAAQDLVGVLDGRAPKRLRAMRKQQQGFEKRLRKHWGSALDQYQILWVCLQEQGSDFNDRRGPENDPLQGALAGLHAKACRVAWEVHTLLHGGLAMGALARCRTLHEMAVLTSVLVNWQGPGPVLIPDLVERFNARAAIVTYKDALEYQRNAADLKVVPFTPSEMAEMEKAKDDVVARFGPLINKKDYGWATGVGGCKEPSFADLESASGLGHLRSYYKWASHEVHADAKGVFANVVNSGYGNVLLTGPSNVGLSDPGQSALISLSQITTFLLVRGGQTPGPKTVIGMQAVLKMLNRACDSFAAGERAVKAAGERAMRRRDRLDRIRSLVALRALRSRLD